jgi:hypothetical protein
MMERYAAQREIKLCERTPAPSTPLQLSPRSIIEAKRGSFPEVLRCYSQALKQ